MSNRDFTKEAFELLELLSLKSGRRPCHIEAARRLIEEAKNTKYEPPKMLYEALVSASIAADNCKKTGNTKWLGAHERRIESLMKTAPSGSGIDAGTKLLRCGPRELKFRADFHHLNDTGMYSRWTVHTVTVRPSLFDRFTVTISGRDYNDVKEYLHQVFYDWLRAPVKEA